MATTKQKAAINKIVKNGGNVSKAMVEAGYSPNTAHTPQKLTESKAFKEVMYDLGLTDDLLISALVADIKAKPGKRTKELDLGFRITGRLKEEAPLINNGIAIILEKYGLTNAGQTQGAATGLPEDTSRT